MLEARWSLRGYRILDREKEIARICFSVWGAGGTIRYQQKRLKVVPKGKVLINRYELQDGKTCVASLRKEWMPFKVIKFLEFGLEEYCIRDSKVMHQDQLIGKVHTAPQGGWLWSSIEIKVPPSLPTLPKLLLIWDLLDQEIGKRSG
jgi:hypothetical protein